MLLSRSNSVLRMTVAMVLLSLAIVSRAPQNKCRCHEKKSGRTQTQQGKPCVFGQMRSLSSSYVLPISIQPEEKSKPTLTVTVAFPKSSGRAAGGEVERPMARSPPEQTALRA
jgi:hypothetical protein